MLDKTPESPLDCKEIKPVNPKGNQLWIFIGRTEAETEAPFGNLMRRANSLAKSDAGNTEGRKRQQQRVEMVGWHQRLNGHEFEQPLRDSEASKRQGSLVCCSPWDPKKMNPNEWLNSNIYQLHYEIYVTIYKCLILITSNEDIICLSNKIFRCTFEFL